MDLADSALHHAVFVDALAVRYHMLDDKKRNRELEMDRGFGHRARRMRHNGLFHHGRHCALAGVCVVHKQLYLSAKTFVWQLKHA